MATTRNDSFVATLTWAAIAAVALAAVAQAAPPTPAASGSPTAATATQPSTQPAKAPLGPKLAQRWRWYKAAWAGHNITAQSNADAALVESIFKDPPDQIATLREDMAVEYDRLAAATKPDDFQLGRLAARIVAAWTRTPTPKQVTPAQLALIRQQVCNEICRWGVIALKHLGGDIPSRTLTMYKSFVPGTAASVMSLMTQALPIVDDPGDVAEQLQPVHDSLRALAGRSVKAAGARKGIDNFYAALKPLAELQKDKAAVAKLIAAYPKAYNARDTKAFAALWPKDHPQVAILETLPLEKTIPPDCWTIRQWDRAYVIVHVDNVNPLKYQAEAFVVTQYTSKDGKPGPVQLQGFGAHKDPEEGWKLGPPLAKPKVKTGS